MARGRWAGVTLAGALLLAAPATASAAPAVTTSSTAGSPTASVTLTASGFDPSQALDVYFDTTQIALATSDANGAATIAATAPASAQPGKHWFTVVEHSGGVAAQVGWTEQTNWAMDGFGPSGRGFNPYENTLNATNVSGLRLAWSAPTRSSFGNPEGVIRYGGRLFVNSVYDNSLHVFSSGGSLQWTGPTPAANGTPAAASNVVVFTGPSSTVAYDTGCRSDGGACAPRWSIGTSNGVYAATTAVISSGKAYVENSPDGVKTYDVATGAAGPTYSTGSGSLMYGRVAAGPHGDLYWPDYAQKLEYVNANYSGTQSGATSAFAGSPTAPAVLNDRVYFSTADGAIHELFGWSTTVGASLDFNAGVGAAYGKVFAGSSTNFAAYDAGSGAVLWSNTRAKSPYPPAIANGLVYVCSAAYTGDPDNSTLLALDASTGETQWVGGTCTGRPIVADGTVSVPSIGFVDTYSLSPANAASRRGHALAHAPDPRHLHPSARFLRHARHVSHR